MIIHWCISAHASLVTCTSVKALLSAYGFGATFLLISAAQCQVTFCMSYNNMALL